jgi:hypothetical protein
MKSRVTTYGQRFVTTGWMLVYMLFVLTSSSAYGFGESPLITEQDVFDPTQTLTLEELQERTLKTLKTAPFNKLRMSVFPKHYNYNKNEPSFYPFPRDKGVDDFSRFNPAFFDHFESCMADLMELGIEADIIRQNDPYDHMAGIYNCFGFYEHGESWVSHASIKSSALHRAREWRTQYRKPIIYDECRYEGNIWEQWCNQSAHEMTIYKLGGIYKGKTEIPLPPVRKKDLNLGLQYRYYEGAWEDLPDFDQIEADVSSTSSNFGHQVKKRGDYYTLIFEGYIRVKAKGVYTFYSRPDDGSELWFGETLVVDNGDMHGPRERYGEIGLQNGIHPITARFFDAGGGDILEVRYKGPGDKKQIIPPGDAVPLITMN